MPLEVKVRTVKAAEVPQQTDGRKPQADRRSPEPGTSSTPQPIRRVNVYRRSAKVAAVKQEARPAVAVQVINNPPAHASALPSNPDAAAPGSGFSPRTWPYLAAAWMGLLVLTLCVFSPR